MYLDHYHLKAKPFDLSPGPRFLWLGEKHKEALATLNYGIMDDLGFLLLTGDVGVGKTALIHRLTESLDSSTIVAHITDPGLGTIDFFKLLAVEFNIPTEFYSKAPFLIELEKFLYAAYSDNKKVLLIVDEAQRLNNKLLDQIRVLSNIELSDRKLINIFFVGQPEFKTMLMANSNRAIRQRIAINYHINPLTESETGQYIHHRLKVAGATRKIFKPNAIREIFRFSGGAPRAINVICDHALLTGYASGLKSIDSDVIKECENELNVRSGFDNRATEFKTSTGPAVAATRQPPPRRSLSMRVPVLIGLFLVLGVLASYYFLWPGPHWTMTTATQNKLADATDQQTESVAKNRTQASSNTKVAFAQPDKKSDTRDKTTPNAKPAVAETQAPLFMAQTRAAPDPLPYIGELDSKLADSAKAETDATVVAVPAAEPASEPKAAPESKPSTDTPEVDKPATAAGKAAAAVVAILAAEPGPKVNPVPQKEAVAQDAPPAGVVDKGSPGQSPAAELEAEAAPEPKPSTDSPAVDKPATAAGKAAAATVAVLATKPEPNAEPVPRKETTARKADNVADSQAAVSATKAAPTADPPTDTPAAESEATAPGKAETKAAAIAVLAAAKPSSPVKPGNTKSPSVIDQKYAVKAPSSSPRTNESSKKVSSNNQADKNAQPKQVSPGNRSAPPITAKAETQLQPPSQRMGGTATSVKKPDKNNLENRLRSFLQNYCNTYAAKDFDAFTNLFIPDARENGTPFIRLLPKYKKNFGLIETIEYRIELQKFTYDENMGIAKIDGDFFLKWLPPDKQWRENSGKISMSLIEKGSSFLVQRLDYKGGSAKKK